MARVLLFLCFGLLWGSAASAQMGSLFTPASTARLVPDITTETRARAASLFIGEATRGLMAPWEGRSPPHEAEPDKALGYGVAELLDLIAAAEAGPAGYDAVQYGARIKPSAPPTALNLGEIFAWIKATPGQPHAIGRYQFIPATLGRLVNIKGYGPEVQFTPEIQDALAFILLQEAGYSEFQSRALPRRAFMKNLARIWAGLPLPNGRSYYEGYAGNKATMSFARFEAGMAEIFVGS